MQPKATCASGLLLLLVSLSPNFVGRAAAQGKVKPLNANDARLTFSFPVQPGRKPLRLKVELDKAGTLTGVSVFRENEPHPVQTLSNCFNGLPEQLTEGLDDSEISQLIKHDDLNFDGFEDLELLVYDNSHLDKKLYCIYLWDTKAGQFRYSSDLTDIAANVEVHPKNKTITSHEDWFGGPWQDSTYRWVGDKLELIEQNNLLGDWSTQKDGQCGFTFTCSRLINGKMITTLEKDICTPEAMDNLPNCPAAPPSPESQPPKQNQK
jgi:hypothetical protein